MISESSRVEEFTLPVGGSEDLGRANRIERKTGRGAGVLRRRGRKVKETACNGTARQSSGQKVETVKITKFERAAI